MDDIFLSTDEFRLSEAGIATSHAIAIHGDAILRAAELGEPPLDVIVPLIEGFICERSHWRYVDAMIRDWLGTGFEKVGRAKARTRLPHKGHVYARTAS